jgi:glycosyltransferase involved in cell wall biosynthesis
MGGGVGKALKTGGFDVVHLHNYHTALFAQAGRATDLPLVVTPHFHGTSVFALGRAAHVVWSRANSGTWRRARAVIAVAEQESQLLQQRFPSLRDRVQVIPNGVDVPANLTHDYPNAERPTIVVVGRLERHKRIDRVIAALPNVSDAHLEIIGTGPLLEELAALADRLGVASRVKFLGRVTDAELWAAYQSASVFCSLSEIEAFGLTLAEAMTAGTPVVVSDIPAHAEVAAAAADVPATLIAPTAASAEVAAALTTALGQTRQPLASRFPTWSDVAARVRDIYAEVLTATSSGDHE